MAANTSHEPHTEPAPALAMRVSGLLLTALVGVALYSTTMADEGVNRLGYAYLAGRWSNIGWQSADLLLLWLAMLHGGYGMRTIINTKVRRRNTRFWLRAALYTVIAIAITIGTVTVTTFDPAAA